MSPRSDSVSSAETAGIREICGLPRFDELEHPRGNGGTLEAHVVGLAGITLQIE